MTEPLPDLAELLPSWTLALKAVRKSPATIKSYRDGVNAFLRWCDETNAPPTFTRDAAHAFVADLLDNGAQPKTVATRLIPIRRFSSWLTEERDFDSDPILGVKQPKLDKKVVDALSDAELRSLIAACKGKRFIDRRDEALGGVEGRNWGVWESEGASDTGKCEWSIRRVRPDAGADVLDSGQAAPGEKARADIEPDGDVDTSSGEIDAHRIVFMTSGCLPWRWTP